MNFDANQGIEITDEVKKLFETGIKTEGSQGKLATAMGVPPQNVQNWRGHGNRKGVFILWNQWEKIRHYFISHRMIDGSDPRWLTPSEMRERLANGILERLPPDEQQLLEQFRLLTDDGKLAALATLKGLANTFNKDAQTSAHSSTA